MLELADRSLVRLQEALEAAARADALDDDQVDRLRATAYEIAARVNHDLPPHLDADSRDEIRRHLLSLLTLGPYGHLPDLDVADKVLIEAEALRHVMRDLLQEQPPAALRDAGEVVRLLESWLPGVSVKDLSKLLGVSDRALQRRRQEGGESTARMQLVARLIAVLRHGWTDRGVVAWFHRPRREFGGQTPFALLEDPARERDLLTVARSGRVQGAA